jgi:hypothetical protein
MICEEWRLAAMALADGETPPAPHAEIESHLAGCEGCRREIEQLNDLVRMWQGHSRSDYEVDLWPEIQCRLKRPKRHWLPPFVVLLVIFKLADFVVDRNFGLWVQLVPVLIAGVAFAMLRQNPFQIRTELTFRENEP